MKKMLIYFFCFGICYSGKTQVIDTLIDVGGYRLHFNIIKGKGVPILFESGGGDDGTVWNDLLKKLHDSIGATLITYDRQGMGLSKIDTSKINILNEVKGLEIGLKKLGYANNLFVVSHSLGSSYAILYASRNSKIIKGSVFIDINLPCFLTKQKGKELKESYANEMEMFKKQRIGVYYILLNYEKTTDLMSKTVYPSKIPSTIIGSDIPPFKGIDSTKWKDCQKSFGTLPNHKYVLAKNCEHYVFKDNPELVINEIVKLYRQVAIRPKK